MGVQITSLCIHNMEDSEGSYAGSPGPWRACPHICFIWVVTGEKKPPHSLFSDLFLSLSKVKDIHGQLPAADAIT